MNTQPVILIEPHDDQATIIRKINANFARLSRGPSTVLNDVIADEVSIKIVDEAVVPGTLESYFNALDSEDSPSAPTNLVVGAAFRSFILAWDLPPDALHRTWEVYMDEGPDFIPDTTTFTNRVLNTSTCTASIEGAPEDLRYFKVCALNRAGVRSEFTSGSGELAQIITTDMVDAIIDASKLAEGAVDLGENTVTGSLTTDRLTAGTALIGDALIAALSAEKVTAGDLSADVILTSEITTDQLVAGEALIGSALIADLDAAKINTGTLTGVDIYGGEFALATDAEASTGGWAQIKRISGSLAQLVMGYRASFTAWITANVNSLVISTLSPVWEKDASITLDGETGDITLASDGTVVSTADFKVERYLRAYGSGLRAGIFFKDGTTAEEGARLYVSNGNLYFQKPGGSIQLVVTG